MGLIDLMQLNEYFEHIVQLKLLQTGGQMFAERVYPYYPLMAYTLLST